MSQEYEEIYLPPYFAMLGNYSKCGRLAKMDKPVCDIQPVPYSTQPRCGIGCDYRQYPLKNLQYSRVTSGYNRIGNAYNLR